MSECGSNKSVPFNKVLLNFITLVNKQGSEFIPRSSLLDLI